jgi:RNA polymerase sigma-70 factor (ECF subfamily)
MATALVLDDERAHVAQLVIAAQAGDRLAFGELFECFERRVYAIAWRRLRNHCEAQELCQEVFIRVLVKLDQLRTPELFGAWIRAIAHRMAINRAVRRAPDLASETNVLEAACADEQTPLCNVLAGERREHVTAALRRLRKLDRETLKSFYLDGRSLKEMCDEFDAPLGTIKRRLHNARRRLAKEVELLTAV